MPIPEIIAAGKVVMEAAEIAGPKAAAVGLNLLEVTAAKTGFLVPSQLKAMVYVGPKNGMIEIPDSVEAGIGEARAFESASQTPYANQNFREFPQLLDTRRTNTLVIGGGFAGLSIADKLAGLGIKTILVDGGRIGEGTSQFAGGMITRAGDPSFVELGETYGGKTVERYAKGMVNAHQTVMRRASSMGNRVDFHPSNSHQLSYDRSAAAEWMRDEHRAVSSVDSGISIVTGKKASQIFEPAQAVMTFHGEGQLNPLKYTKQLAANAQHAIFENTQVVGLQVGKPGGPITALTANGGRIEADRVVFATGTGKTLFRDLDHCVEGAQCFAGIAETPSPIKLLGNAFDTDGAVRDASGVIRNRNTEGAYNYFRKPADALAVPHSEGSHLLLFGGADKMMPETAATLGTPELEQQLHTLFPGSKMLHSWTGLIEESSDGMPIIAQHNEFPQVFGIRGIGGSGIDSSQFVAEELAKTFKGGNSVLSSTRFAGIR